VTPPRNAAASVRDRLLQRAKREGRPFEELLTYYAIERFLYRLSQTDHASRLVLKGALMLPLWGTSIARATRDIDMLGRVSMSAEAVETMVRECMQVVAEPDGLEYVTDSIVLSEIRKDERYGGVRATFQAGIERTRIHLQLDVGFGDVVTPSPVAISYPTLLDHPAPVLAGYPPVTAIAEKLNAIVDLGMANSRMKDYFDLWSLSRALELDGALLASAIAATFRRRETAIPPAPPVGLTAAFGSDAAKQQQWNAFLRRIRAVDALALHVVVDRVAAFLVPAIAVAARGESWVATWPPGGPWRSE
jgi:hypothetical protein